MPDNYKEAEKRTWIKKIESDATRIYEPTRTSPAKSVKSGEPILPAGAKNPRKSPCDWRIRILSVISET